jgi:hypothetical protein
MEPTKDPFTAEYEAKLNAEWDAALRQQDDGKDRAASRVEPLPRTVWQEGVKAKLRGDDIPQPAHAPRFLTGELGRAKHRAVTTDREGRTVPAVGLVSLDVSFYEVLCFMTKVFIAPCLLVGTVGLIGLWIYSRMY